jgi:RNA polymerase sigma-70 factor, ECF subfamily
MENIVKEYLKSVYNFVFRITRDENMAEDVAEETFIKVWKHHLTKKITHPDCVSTSLITREVPPNLKPWIFKIARNTAIDYLRKRKNISFSQIDSKNATDNENENSKSFEENIADLEPLPDKIFERKELAQELNEALEKIRPDFAEIIFLHYNENLSFEEIAEVVGKPLNTVKSWHLRALEALRKILVS